MNGYLGRLLVNVLDIFLQALLVCPFLIFTSELPEGILRISGAEDIYYLSCFSSSYVPILNIFRVIYVLGVFGKKDKFHLYLRYRVKSANALAPPRNVHLIQNFTRISGRPIITVILSKINISTTLTHLKNSKTSKMISDDSWIGPVSTNIW